jgi:acetate---CoA ligase (ADP-forming)
VALIASERSPFARHAYSNLARFGLGARTHLVTRRGGEVHGVPSVTSCGVIGEPVDVAFVMVARDAVPAALADAAGAGVRNALILSSGYAEAGPSGRAAEAELVAQARSLDVLVLGPNHLGFANFVEQIPVTALRNLPRRCGPVAVVSQSGAAANAMIDFAAAASIGLSYVITVGNEAMITVGHVLDFLIQDETTRSIAVFMEAVRDARLFREAAGRALAAGKAVVVLKVGTSALGARAALSHTGALAGDDASASAVFRELGVVRVPSLEDLLITAGAAARLGVLDRDGVGVVCSSGGACEIVADAAQETGMPLPRLAEPTAAALRAVLPTFAAVDNPLDVTGAAVTDPSLLTAAVAAMSRDPSVGVVAVVGRLPWAARSGPWPGQQRVNAIGAGIAGAPVPVVYVSTVLQPITERTRQVMAEGGVPYAIPGLRHATTALRNVGWWSALAAARRDSGHPPSPAVTAGEWTPGPAPSAAALLTRRAGDWSEVDARSLLAQAGVPVVPAVLARDPDEAAAAAAGFGGPVSVKLVSPQVPHKSDIGGVALWVQGDPAVRAAFDAVMGAASAVPGASAVGALVSPMRAGGTELLVGVHTDPQWGPMLAVALGGVFVELLDDSVLVPLPASAAAVRAALSSLRAWGVLSGSRGRRPADVEALIAVIGRVGDLALALAGQVESLEVNPLYVDGSTIEALDARVNWRE